MVDRIKHSTIVIYDYKIVHDTDLESGNLRSYLG